MKFTIFIFIMLAFEGLKFVNKCGAKEHVRFARQLTPILEDIKKVEAGVLAILSKNKVCYQFCGCFYSAKGRMAHIAGIPDNPNNINTKFLTYTRSNKFKSFSDVSYWNNQTLRAVPLRSKVAFWVHGYGGKGSNYETAVKALGTVYETVILVDWQNGAVGLYTYAALNAQLVGRQIGVLVERLKTNRQINPDNVHLIGFSLGAHVAGFAGEWTQKMFGFKIGRITALDPANLLFEGHKCHVNQYDAKFVDSIHTSAGNSIETGQLGMESAVGHVDFWPNGGRHQPGCNEILNHGCSHKRAVELFLASLEHNRCKFYSYPCKTWLNFKKGHCTRYDTEMGFFLSRSAKGNHYLKTTKKFPFCNTSVKIQ